MGTLQRLGDYVCSPTVPPAFDPRPLVRLESSSRSLPLRTVRPLKLYSLALIPWSVGYQPFEACFDIYQ